MKIKLLVFYLMTLCTISKAQFSKLIDFNSSNGAEPWGSLIFDGNFLYGMTSYGGIYDMGIIFKIKPDGSGYTKLLDFNGSNGSNPFGSLLFDGNFFYGMTYYGGVYNWGVLFKIKPDGSGYTKLLDFDGSNGGRPTGSLIIQNGFLYGMTSGGGVNYNCANGTSCGVIFKIKPDGTNYSKLLDFDRISNGSHPRGDLIADSIYLYGMTFLGGANQMGTLFKIRFDGTGYQKLIDFEGIANGSEPFGSLISDGNFFYGMTKAGGTLDWGTIFKIKPDGTGFLKLHDFGSLSSTDADGPDGTLIFDDNFLYGVGFGGKSGFGAIFKIKPDGTNYTKIFDFDFFNGAGPYGCSLVSDGTFHYGMMTNGGTSTNCTNRCGVLFKINPNNPCISTFSSKTAVACDNYVWNGNTYAVSGTYKDTIPNTVGCDSIMTLNLTIKAADTSVTQSQNILTANATGASYQWIDCDNGNAPIANETNQSFTATGNGSYAVIVTENGCMDTSACHTITGIGIMENSFGAGLMVFPNPTNGKLSIDLAGNYKNITVQVRNIAGQLVFKESFGSKQLVELNLESLANGIYLVKIAAADKSAVVRVVKGE